MLHTLRVNVQRFLALVISFGLLLMSPGAQQFVIAQVESSEYEQALANLDIFMDKLEELRSHIDRTQFDVEELSFELAPEGPEAIIDWVRNNIYFEQYPGLLRGAQGTLMSRAGNALDQAILLQKLLSDAGYETQIARGLLSDKQAQLLVQQMTVPREPEPDFGDLDAMKQVMINIGEIVGTPSEEIETLFEELDNTISIETTEIYQNVQEDTDFILSMLEEAGIELGDPEAMSKLLEESKDYFWLEYRLSSKNDWQAVHPVFHDANMVPNELETSEVFTGTIPESFQHRFRLQVFIEQKIDNELKINSIIDAWEKPAFELVGKPMTYTNFPDSLVDSTSQDLEDSIEKTAFFAPILNRALAEGGDFFDLDGNIIDPVSGSSPFAGVHQGVGSLVGDAAGLFSELGEDSVESAGDFITLTGQWIEYTIITPNGEESKHRRTVVDRIGINNRIDDSLQIESSSDKPSVFKALTQEHTFMLGTGELSQGFILNQLLSDLISLESAFAGLIAQNYDIDVKLDLSLFEGIDTAWRGHFLLYPTFDQDLFASKNTLTYRSEPNLILHQRGLGANETNETTQEIVDIADNTRRTFEIEGVNLFFNTKQAVGLGIWETHVEQLFIPNIAVAKRLNTMIVFDTAKADKVPTAILQSGDSLRRIELSEDIKYFIKQDLDNGYIVLAPESSELAGWWRVNPQTGETLGMAGTGRGIAMEEYIQALLHVGLNFGLCMFVSSSLMTESVRNSDTILCALTSLLGLAAVIKAMQVLVGLNGLAQGRKMQQVMGIASILYHGAAIRQGVSNNRSFFDE